MKNDCEISISALSATEIINKHSNETPEKLMKNMDNHKYI